MAPAQLILTRRAAVFAAFGTADNSCCDNNSCNNSWGYLNSPGEICDWAPRQEHLLGRIIGALSNKYSVDTFFLHDIYISILNEVVLYNNLTDEIAIETEHTCRNVKRSAFIISQLSHQLIGISLKPSSN